MSVLGACRAGVRSALPLGRLQRRCKTDRPSRPGDDAIRRYQEREEMTRKAEEVASRAAFENKPSFPTRDAEHVAETEEAIKNMQRSTTKADKWTMNVAGASYQDPDNLPNFMRSKEEKAGEDYTNTVALPGDDAGSKQADARNVALSLNPFGGQGAVAKPSEISGSVNANGAMHGTFLDYVEKEQDYFARSATESQQLALGRMQARKAVEKRAAEARTTEVLSAGAGGQVARKGTASRGNHKPLLIQKWDMNSFTLSDLRRVVGSLIIYKHEAFLWDCESVADMTMEKLMPLAHLHPVPKFITMGTGLTVEPLHPDLHMFMRGKGTRIDVMSTEKAISVWHQINSDGYQAALALMCLEPTSGFDYGPYHQYWKHKKDRAHGRRPT